MKPLLSPRQLADLLGLAEQTIYNWHSLGKDLPPSIKIGNRLRFPVDGVEAWRDAKMLRARHPAYSDTSPSPLAKRAPGRPKKADQIAARRTCV